MSPSSSKYILIGESCSFAWIFNTLNNTYQMVHEPL